MTARRRLAFWALVAAQALVPLVLVGWNEVALATGERVRLATVPVDPLDLFRGRYVTLRYGISSLRVNGDVERGATVYVPLTKGGGGVWSGSYATPIRPEGGTFIRGRVTSRPAGAVTIEYGIETYYADEDEAPELEQSAGRGRLYVDVVLDDDGGAKIDGIERAD